MSKQIELIKAEIERRNLKGKSYYPAMLMLLDIIDSLHEEPSEDIGQLNRLSAKIEELSQQFPEVSFAKLSRICVRMAEWQKEQDERLIKLAHDSWYKEGIINGKFEELSEDEKYQQGRFDMKEQMMKNAISCKVDWLGCPLLDYTIEQQNSVLEKINASVGDNVKIIIIKED